MPLVEIIEMVRLEIGSRVCLCWSMIGFQGALEGTRSACRGATGFSLLCCSGATKAGTIADQLFVLLLAASLVAKSPVEDTGGGENDGSANTNSYADDCIPGRGRKTAVVCLGPIAAREAWRRNNDSLRASHMCLSA